MDYAADDYPEIARRLRDIERGSSGRTWGLWCEHESYTGWCRTLDSGMLEPARGAFANTPARFSSYEEADTAMKAWQALPTSANHDLVTAREFE